MNDLVRRSTSNILIRQRIVANNPVSYVWSLRYVFSWGSGVTYLSTFGVRTSYVFIRLMLPIFFCEAVCSNVYNVEH